MPIPDKEAKEELRYAVRRYLAARPVAALTVDMIHNGMRAKGCTATEKELLEALAFWTGTTPQIVTQIRLREHSTLKAYQITTAGILAEERGE